MNYKHLFLLLITISFTGCLDFGNNEETTSPTEVQVERCRAEMYINPSIEITTLGFKLEGSGIDDAIWFKFETNIMDLHQIFDSNIVDTYKFENNYTSLYEVNGLEWWDVKGKKLIGGQVELPNVRFMNVGIEKKEKGYVVYIMWHET